MRRLVVLAIAPFALLGCTVDGNPGASDVGTHADGIINGEPATEDGAVVALTYSGQTFCTGTVVSPHVVLTAAHCITEGPGSGITVYFGANANTAGGVTLATTETLAHPEFDIDMLPNDVGLVRLAEPAPVLPVPLASAVVDDSLVGSPARIVGFGLTSENGVVTGVKYEGSAYLDQYFGSTFSLAADPSLTYSGDSGGPTFLMEDGKEVVAGIHSRGDAVSLSIEESVEAHVATFIVPFIGDDPLPTCALDGLCAAWCEPADVDCSCKPNGVCAAECPDPLLDPDCDPHCVGDGECVKGCGTPDPDCACHTDGACDDASCPGDLDCIVLCAPDGACAPECQFDPDCDQAEPAAEPPPAEEDGGCALAAGAGSRRFGPAWLALVATLLRRRRRR